MKVLPLSRRSLQAREALTVKLLFAYDENVVITVRNKEGEELPVRMNMERNGDEMTVKLFPPRRFKPGTYLLRISDLSGNVQTQEFTWGVLAINTNKSIYFPKENADIAMAVLDEMGNMICKAHVTLEITTPSGKTTTFGTFDRTIVINPECKMRDVTNRPDYEAHYQIEQETGAYQMKLTAETANGIHTVTDRFDVRNSMLFDIERIGPTRIYPIKKYVMKFNITAHQDFEGTIVETVPEDFVIEPAGDPAPDKVATVSAGLDKGSILGAQSPSMRMPFDGNFQQTLGFGEQPEDERLAAHYKKFGLPAHDGVDFAVPLGTPLVAVDDGEIIMAGPGPYGITVIIKHSWGKSYYGHLSETKLEIHQKVSKSDTIGLSGNTGLSTGPHLHFAIRPTNVDEKNGYFGKMNPLIYVNKESNSQVLAAFSSVVTQKEISWNVNLKKGEYVTLSYRFDAPNVSPQFYLLGPLRFESGIRNQELGIRNEQEESSESSSFTIQDQSFATSSASPSAQPASNSVQPTIDSPITVFEESRMWQIASDADVTIDDTIDSADNTLKYSPKLVFTSDQVGYIFYTDGGGGNSAKYSKTIDGGASWAAAAEYANKDGELTAVWYDQWTPGDTGNTTIHIISGDGALDDVYYIPMDTSDDSFGAVTLVTNITSGTLTAADDVAITKSSGGVLYAGLIDNGNVDLTRVLQCKSSCTTASNWNDTGDALEAASGDNHLLVPYGTGNNILLVRDDASQDDLDSATYNGTSWTTLTDFETDFVENAPEKTYQMAVRRLTGDVYLTYVPNAGINDTSEVRTAIWDGSSWTSTTDALANSDTASTDKVEDASIALDEETGDVYVGYIYGSTSNWDVFYKKSTDGMSTWTNETQINTSNINGDSDRIWLNGADSERIYAAYRESVLNDLYGITIADLTPPALDEILKHGEWWSRIGLRKSFSF